MKENIDLTLDRTFHEEDNQIETSINKKVFSIFDVENDYSDFENEIFFTGSREIRQMKKDIADYYQEEMEYCFRCGKVKLPYEDRELCRDCKKDLEKELESNPFEIFN